MLKAFHNIINYISVWEATKLNMKETTTTETNPIGRSADTKLDKTTTVHTVLFRQGTG